MSAVRLTWYITGLFSLLAGLCLDPGALPGAAWLRLALLATFTGCAAGAAAFALRLGRRARDGAPAASTRVKVVAAVMTVFVVLVLTA